MLGRDIWVGCDRCDAEHHADAGDWTVTQLRMSARQDGWISNGRVDLCPEHRRSARLTRRRDHRSGV